MPSQQWIRPAIAALSLTAAVGAHGQTWPTKPVTVIVPLAPGGGVDIVARLLSAKLAEKLGQPFVVENRAGASGNIGSSHVARSAPDGQTLLLGSAANFAINQNLYKTIPYKPSDIANVTVVVEYPNVLIVRKDSPFNSVKDLVAYARKNPGKLNYGTAGTGIGFLCTQMLSFAERIELTNIPYKGSGPSLVALLGGEVDLNFDTLAVYAPQIKAGKLKPLAVSTDKRSPSYPDIPTMQEAGVENFYGPGWFGLGVSAATPAPIIKKINEEFRAVLKEPDVRAALEANGFTARGDDLEATQKFILKETEKWAQVIRAANISLD